MRVIHIREVIGITLDINLGRFWKNMVLRSKTKRACERVIISIINMSDERMRENEIKNRRNL